MIVCSECRKKTKIIGFEENDIGSYFVVYYCSVCNKLYFSRVEKQEWL